MTFKPYLIANHRIGLELDMEPWILPQDAYPTLENFYLYQGRIIKRKGYQPFGGTATADNDTIYLSGWFGGSGWFDEPWFDTSGSYQGTLDHMPVVVGTLTITTETETFTDNGDGTLTGSGGGTGTIDYVSGEFILNFVVLPLDFTTTVTFDYYSTPMTIAGLPIMGIFNYINQLGNRELLVFNTTRMYSYNTITNEFDDIAGSDIWTGSDFDYFFVQNWQNRAFICNGVDPLYVYDGTTLTELLLDITNNSWHASNAYAEDDIVQPTVLSMNTAKWVNFKCTVAGTSDSTEPDWDYTIGNTTTDNSVTWTAQARNNDITGGVYIGQFKNRLILFRPTESALTKPTRVRWCAVGTWWDWPADSWLDADTSSWMAAGAQLTNTLIGFFERGIRVLRYLGSFYTPFYWQNVASNEGLVSQFGLMELEDEIIFLSVTRLAAVDGREVTYIDKKIPNLILNMNQQNLKYSYTGLLDSINQLWVAYPSSDSDQYNDKVVTLNMDENSWSLFDMPMHCFGYYKNVAAGRRWSDLTMPWNQLSWRWNDKSLDVGYPLFLGGDVNGNLWHLDNGGLDNGAIINGHLKTAKINPFTKEGQKCRMGWFQMMVDTNPSVIAKINLYSDHNTTPYATYDVLFDDGKGQLKSWINIPSGVLAQFHQIEILHDGLGDGVVIHAMIPYCAPGGPIR